MATSTDKEWWRDQANVHAIHHYAHMAGLLFKPPGKDGKDAITNIPVTLQPAKFPEELYQLVWQLQPDFNYLLDAVSRDTQFLEESLQK